MNDRETSRSWRAPLCRILCVAALLFSTQPVRAQLGLTTDAVTQYEYNSNPFDLPKPQVPGYALPAGSGSNYGDSFIGYGGKLDASYLLSQQRFFATVQGNEIHYDRFTQLNHSDYTLDGTWDWAAGLLWDGVVDVTRSRTMVSFTNLAGTQLVLDTEQRETGKAGLQISPDWRAEVTGLERHADQPALGAPDLNLNESSGQGAVKYTGTSGITSGLSATYLKGKFNDTGTLLAPSYDQTTIELTASDESTGLSTFRGHVGYSRRSSSSDLSDLSGVTGELDYVRKLTGKTTVEVDLTRQFGAYLSNTSSAIDSVAALTANWQATSKINVLLTYSFDYRQLPYQGDTPIGSDRTDRLNLGTLKVTYVPVSWLLLQPYVRYQDRASKNYLGGDFNSSVVGIQVNLQFQHGVLATRAPLY